MLELWGGSPDGNASREPGADGGLSIGRLEALSDTVFGVAMTLLAYHLPVPEQPDPPPHWSAFLARLSPHLMVLALSFFVTGLFWLSHNRRLALATSLTSSTVLLNLPFLFAIVVLPVTTNLLGSYGQAGDTIAIYATHLAILSCINLGLCALAIRGSPQVNSAASWRQAAPAGFTTLVFIPAALLASAFPLLAQWLLFLAFLTPFLKAGLRQQGSAVAHRYWGMKRNGCARRSWRGPAGGSPARVRRSEPPGSECCRSDR